MYIFIFLHFRFFFFNTCVWKTETTIHDNSSSIFISYQQSCFPCFLFLFPQIFFLFFLILLLFSFSSNLFFVYFLIFFLPIYFFLQYWLAYIQFIRHYQIYILLLLFHCACAAAYILLQHRKSSWEEYEAFTSFLCSSTS